MQRNAMHCMQQQLFATKTIPNVSKLDKGNALEYVSQTIEDQLQCKMIKS